MIIQYVPPLSSYCWDSCLIFFFQAEDGIRDWSVTGVQTCALPIMIRRPPRLVSDWSSDVCSSVPSRRRHTRLVSDWSSDVCSFFPSRRRHTRLVSDWSSDVCSSDLFCLRSEEHTSELQSLTNLVCRLLLEIGRAQGLNQVTDQSRMPSSACKKMI